jgi:hypothetical protein
MQLTQGVRCPNCGSQALRHILSDRLPQTLRCPDNRALQTECPTCDYLMVMCSLNGAVVEAYAPGMSGEGCTSRYDSPPAQPQPQRWSHTIPRKQVSTPSPVMR